MTRAKSCVYLSDVPGTSLRGKIVLVRADFNVLDEKTGELKSGRRIERTLPTIDYIHSRYGKIVLMTHVGRPKGKPVPHLRTDEIAVSVAALTGLSLTKSNVVSGSEVSELVRSTREGHIILLENVRFAPGETTGSVELASEWASFADVLVFDAFGVGHRAEHASVGVVAEIMRKQGKLVAKGLLVEEEERNLDRVIVPKRPLAVVIGGGAKGISEKIETTKALMERMGSYDGVLIGGLLGNWLQGPTQRVLYGELIAIAKARSIELVFTQDPLAHDGQDIDPETSTRFEAVLHRARTVFWNGPLGVYEDPRYRTGTERLAAYLARRTAEGKMISVLGGGDTEAAIAACGLKETDFTFVSTGGGASLRYLESGSLPVDRYLSSPEVV